MDCLFCKIINGDIPSYKIYEDDIVLCFLDINPDSTGHTLLIPKKHYQDLYDIDDNTLSHILIVSRKVCTLLKEKLQCDGVTFVQNNGQIQEVKHFHLHLKPYYKNNKIKKASEIYELLKK